MSADWKKSSGCWLGLILGFVMGGTVFAQSGNISPQASGSSTALATYQQELGALVQERRTLVSQGATQQQLQAWREQNAPEFEALQQLASQVGLARALEPKPILQQAALPTNASAAMKNFLTARTTLMNSQASIHNTLLKSLPESPSQDQIGAMLWEARQIYQQQNAANLQLFQQEAEAVASEAASQTIAVPKQAIIPPNATSQLQAFLTLRNALARDRAALWNQYLTADPATRRAAMQQLRQQNASRLNQMSSLAQAIFESKSNQEGTSQ